MRVKVEKQIQMDDWSILMPTSKITRFLMLCEFVFSVIVYQLLSLSVCINILIVTLVDRACMKKVMCKRKVKDM